MSISSENSDRLFNLVDVSKCASLFRSGEYAGYTIVMTGLYWLVSAPINLIIITSNVDDPLAGPLGLIIFLLVSSVYGVAAPKFWRNMGNVESMLDTSSILLLISVIPVVILLAILQIAGTGLGLGLGLAVPSAITSLVAAVSLLRLRRSRMGDSTVLLRSVLSELGHYKNRHSTTSLMPARNPTLGYTLLGGSLLWMAIVIWIPLLSVILLIPGYFGILYARSFFQPEGGALLSSDHRRPILILRSFQDDRKVDITESRRVFWDSVEARLAGHFGRLGPFIAVGSPKHGLPQLGAARTRLDDAEWQRTVLAWMETSQIIIFMAALTHWAAWELKQIVALGHIEKLIIVFPRVGGSLSRRLEAVREAFVGTPWEPGLSKITEAGSIRSISFEQPARVILVTSRPDNRTSYQLGALIAHYLILQAGGKAPGAALTPEADNDIVKIPHENQNARSLTPSQAFYPEIENIAQVELGRSSSEEAPWRVALFQNRWWVVVATVLALTVGADAVAVTVAGVSLRQLNVGSGTFAKAWTLHSLIGVVSCPIFGWMIDRWGVRRILIPGLIIYALGTAAYALADASAVVVTYAVYAVTGLISPVQGPIAYSTVISRRFDRHRGLALGIGMAGIGLGMELIPRVEQLIAAEFGGRMVFVGLAIAVLVFACVPVALFIRELPPLSDGAREAASRGLSGTTVREALRSWPFWGLGLAFFCAPFALNGSKIITLFMAHDRGIGWLITTVSAIGFARLPGPVLSGWLIDRFWGPYVAVGFFTLSMVGIAMLISGAGGAAPYLGGMALGLGLAAEISLTAFLASRYFGSRHYGKIFGTIFGMFGLGFVVGPLLDALAFQHYTLILGVYEIMLFIACLILMRLGPYPYPVEEPRRSAS